MLGVRLSPRQLPYVKEIKGTPACAGRASRIPVPQHYGNRSQPGTHAAGWVNMSEGCGPAVADGYQIAISHTLAGRGWLHLVYNRFMGTVRMTLRRSAAAVVCALLAFLTIAAMPAPQATSAATTQEQQRKTSPPYTGDLSVFDYPDRDQKLHINQVMDALSIDSRQDCRGHWSRIGMVHGSSRPTGNGHRTSICGRHQSRGDPIHRGKGAERRTAQRKNCPWKTGLPAVASGQRRRRTRC